MDQLKSFLKLGPFADDSKEKYKLKYIQNVFRSIDSKDTNFLETLIENLMSLIKDKGNIATTHQRQRIYQVMLCFLEAVPPRLVPAILDLYLVLCRVEKNSLNHALLLVLGTNLLEVSSDNDINNLIKVIASLLEKVFNSSGTLIELFAIRAISILLKQKTLDDSEVKDMLKSIRMKNSYAGLKVSANFNCQTSFQKEKFAKAQTALDVLRRVSSSNSLFAFESNFILSRLRGDSFSLAHKDVARFLEHLLFYTQNRLNRDEQPSEVKQFRLSLPPSDFVITRFSDKIERFLVQQFRFMEDNEHSAVINLLFPQKNYVLNASPGIIQRYFDILGSFCFDDFLPTVKRLGFYSKFRTVLRIIIEKVPISIEKAPLLLILVSHPFITDERYSPSGTLLSKLLQKESDFGKYLEDVLVVTAFEEFVIDKLALFERDDLSSYFVEAIFVAYAFLVSFKQPKMKSKMLALCFEQARINFDSFNESNQLIIEINKKLDVLHRPQEQIVEEKISEDADEDAIYESIKRQKERKIKEEEERQANIVEVGKLNAAQKTLYEQYDRQVKAILPSLSFFTCLLRSSSLENDFEFMVLTHFLDLCKEGPSFLGRKPCALKLISVIVEGHASEYSVTQWGSSSSISEGIFHGFHKKAIHGSLLLNRLHTISPMELILILPMLVKYIEGLVESIRASLMVEYVADDTESQTVGNAAYVSIFLDILTSFSIYLKKTEATHFLILKAVLLCAEMFEEECVVTVRAVFCGINCLENSVRETLFSQNGLLSDSSSIQNVSLEVLLQINDLGVHLTKSETAVVFLLTGENEVVATKAHAVLKKVNFSETEELFSLISEYLDRNQPRIIKLVGLGFLHLAERLADKSIEVFQGLFKKYQGALDAFVEAQGEYCLLDSVLIDSKKGRNLKNVIDKSNCLRYGIATTFATVFSKVVYADNNTNQSAFLESYFGFLLEKGIVDNVVAVRNAFLVSGSNLVNNYGEGIAPRVVQLLTPLLENYEVSSLEVSTVQQNKKSSEERKKKKSKVVSLSAIPVKKKSKKVKTKKKKVKKEKVKTEVKENIGSPASWKSQAAVIFLGGLVPYISKDVALRKLIPKVFTLLIKSLVSYEENVQRSASQCLGKIVSLSSRISSEIELPDEFSDLLTKIYADLPGDLTLIRPMKQGVAFGIASILSNVGIETFCEFVELLLEKLRDSMEEEKKPARRIVSLTLLGAIIEEKGVLFEPYLYDMIPCLLLCFGDGKKLVREESKRLSKSIMKKISVVGLKMILPLIIDGFSEEGDTMGNKWRIKESSIRILGSVAYLDQMILAEFLPLVIPKLMSCFVDSQVKIQTAARKAITEIATVVQNVELRSMSKLILKALIEPEEYIDETMSSLSKLKLTADIDAAALAILIPLLKKGLKEKKSETKINAAIVIGRISNRVRSNVSLLSTLIELLPLIKPVLSDPIPTARNTAAKTLRNLALGNLSKDEFENVITSFDYHGTKTIAKDERTSQLNELLRYLLTSLFEGQSSVERSGGANGLVEILSNLESIEMLSRFLTINIMPKKSSRKAEEREGVLWTFVFLPLSFGPKRNKPLLSYEFQTILLGLEDENDAIRSVGVRAGKSLIHLHVKDDAAKLVHEVLNALQSSKWRVKVATLHLLNDLLYLVGKNQSEPEKKYNFGNEEEGFKEINISNDDEEEYTSSEDESEEKENKQVSQELLSKDTNLIAKALGARQRNIIFSKLFLLRSDSNISVRNSAIKVWKNYVFQSGKLVKIMLGDLLKSIILELKSESIENKSMASMALGELVTKHAGRVLPRVIPFLETKFFSSNETAAFEAILCLVEVVRFADEEQTEIYFNSISRIIEAGLVNGDNEKLRRFSAISFDLLYKKASELTVKKMIPRMLQNLEECDQGSDENKNILRALQLMIEKRSNQILPFLLPKLVKKRASLFEIRALRDVCRVSGPSLHSHYRSIVGTLYQRLIEKEEDEDAVQVIEQVVENVSESHLPKLIEVVLDCITLKKVQVTSVGLLFVHRLLKSLQLEFESGQTLLIAKSVFQLYTNNEDLVVSRLQDVTIELFARNECKAAFIEQVDVLRGTIKTVISKLRFSKATANQKITLQVFKSDKVLAAFSEMYKQILTSATSEHNKEFAALGIGDLIMVSPEIVLNPRTLIKITGPLIRASSERLDGNTRTAIFGTLLEVCLRGGSKLKALAPQLISSCLKNFSTDNVSVRLKCLDIIPLLVCLTPRVDNIFREFFKIVNDEEKEKEIAASAFEGMSCVLVEVPQKAKPQYLLDILSFWPRIEECEDVGILVSYSRCLGRAIKVLLENKTPDEAEKLISEEVIYLVEAGLASSKGKDFLFLQALTACTSVIQCAPLLKIIVSQRSNIFDWFEKLLKVKMNNDDLKLQLKLTRIAFYFALLEMNEFDNSTKIIKEISSTISIGGQVGSITLKCLALLVLRDPTKGIFSCNSMASILLSSLTKKAVSDEANQVFSAIARVLGEDSTLEVSSKLVEDVKATNFELSVDAHDLYLVRPF